MATRELNFLERCAREIPGAQLGDGVFTAGQAIWCGTREVAHFHDGSGDLEVRLTKVVVSARRAELKADTRVTLRKSASDWIAFALTSTADEDDALELVRAAVDANAPTAPVGPPPTGADLARRRRFH
jgi:hypothetical protein